MRSEMNRFLSVLRGHQGWFVILTTVATPLLWLLLRSTSWATTEVVQGSRKYDIADVDGTLNDLQTRFEQGRASEIELRNAYRPFYDQTRWLWTF